MRVLFIKFQITPKHFRLIWNLLNCTLSWTLKGDQATKIRSYQIWEKKLNFDKNYTMKRICCQNEYKICVYILFLTPKNDTFFLVDYCINAKIIFFPIFLYQICFARKNVEKIGFFHQFFIFPSLNKMVSVRDKRDIKKNSILRKINRKFFPK